MNRQATILAKLTDALSPMHLEVHNESHAHNVPAGSETHFKIVVVSDRFDGLSSVKRHQLVYAALSGELASGLHALAITSRTPSEWTSDPTSNVSPKCHGGSGK